MSIEDVKTPVEWVVEASELCLLGEGSLFQERKDEFVQLKQSFECFNSVEKKRIKDIWFEYFSNEDLCYIFSILIQYSYIEDVKEWVLEALIKSDYDLSTEIMLAVQVGIFIRGHEFEKRILSKKMNNHLKELLDFHAEYSDPQNRDKKRVVLITEQMLSNNHAPTALTYRYAYMLKHNLNYSVKIVICGCNMILPVSLWYDSYFLQLGKEESGVWQGEYEGEVFDGYQISMNDGDYLEKYKMVLKEIYEWNPGFVINMGCLNPFGDMPDLFTDVVYKNLSAELPITQSRIIIQNTESGRGEVFKNEYGQTVYRGKNLPTYYGKAIHLYDREELELPTDKFLIGIVGNRLPMEITTRFVDVLDIIYAKLPNVAYVLIGNNLEEYHELDEKPYEVHILGYCEDLLGVYNTIDLYLNPIRQGGGFSGEMALCSGVPVITLPDCDVAFHVGKEFEVESETMIPVIVEKYIHDKEFYRMQKKKALLHGERHSEAEMVKGFRKWIIDIEKIIFNRMETC